jgi:hypothetical protein
MGVSAASVDAATAERDDPSAPEGFTLPKRTPRPKGARAQGPSGICATVSPGAVLGSSWFVAWLSVVVVVVACRWGLRRRDLS